MKDREWRDSIVVFSLVQWARFSRPATIWRIQSQASFELVEAVGAQCHSSFDWEIEPCRVGDKDVLPYLLVLSGNEW